MSELKLVATGDVLLHSRVYDISKKDGKYDFKDKMAPAKKLLQDGDISVVNLESIVAGEELGLSSFPEFNNPVELAENLKEFGTDIVTIANNHTLDYGEKGVLKSIENLEKINLPYVGSYKSEQDQQKPRIIEKMGIKVAFFAYSAVNMGGRPPNDKKYLLNRVRRESLKTIRKEIETVKKVEKPDVIVVGAHFGREYGLQPIDEQSDISRSLSDIGADIIIGHHPHVLQPAQWITNSRGKKTFVIYSLGNFYSGQKGLYRQIGGALNLTIKKNSKGKVTIEKPTLDLTFVNASKEKNYQMHLFKDYIELNPYIKTIHDRFDSLDIYTELTNRLTQWMPELVVR
ncbi:CapA family protein [Oceanobacillus oncorhynchi]|uniref:CapA family protein n=1 Tax=Oceanobacillus oncorhynchi TaxID=545501 RepID=UPI0018662ED4|nr:CapA family protein [Oceanobacillus oncorhynchi]